MRCARRPCPARLLRRPRRPEQHGGRAGPLDRGKAVRSSKALRVLFAVLAEAVIECAPAWGGAPTLIKASRHRCLPRPHAKQKILLGRDGRAKVSGFGLAQLLGEDGAADGSAGRLAWASEWGGVHALCYAVQAWLAVGACALPASSCPVARPSALPLAGPEQLAGLNPTDKSDIYALGVVLWQVVTLEAPQRGCLRPPRVPEECPQGVADAIAACIQVRRQHAR